MLRDIRLGFRCLRRQARFATIAVTVLGIGIGASTTVFTLANAFLFRPLPIDAPDRVVRIYRDRTSNSSFPDYVDFRDRNRTLEDVAAYQVTSVSLRSAGRPLHVYGESVTANYFDVLGVRPAIGRAFLPEEGRTQGTHPVAVISYGLWQRQFGGERSVVGRRVSLNGHSFTVIGVAPPGYLSALPPYVADIWVPIMMDRVLRPGTDRITDRAGALMNSVHVIGRLKPAVTLAQTRDDIGAIAAELRRTYPDTHGNRGVSVRPARALHDELQGFFTLFMALLLGLVGFVLLVACVNVAGLQLARLSARRRELGIRHALGATRGVLVRQLVIESAIVAAGGAVAGALLAAWTSALLGRLPLPTPLPVLLDLQLDFRVLCFTVIVAAASVTVIGWLPAVGVARRDLVSTLNGERTESGTARARLRTAFVVAQIALSVPLLITALLLARSMSNASLEAAGLDPRHVLTFNIDVAAHGYGEDRGRVFHRELRERLLGVPGVRAVNLSMFTPLTLSSMNARFLPVGETPAQGSLQPEPIYTSTIDQGHFETLRIPLLAGRDFAESDGPDRPAVVIVNERLANRFWPGEHAIGKRIQQWRGTSPAGAPLEVIGLARDSRYATIGEAPRAFVYRPLTQDYRPALSVLVATHGDPASLWLAIEQVIQQIDPDLPLFNVKPMEDAASVSLLPARAAGVLAGVLAGVAVVLAALGAYGLLSYLVYQRQREIGIRLALGCPTHGVVRMVVHQALGWTALGIATGLLVAVGVTPFISSLLHGVSPRDPLAFAIVPALLGSVVFCASYGPARKASRVDPAAVLR